MNKFFLYAGIGAIGYMGYKLFVQPQMGLISTSPYSKPTAGFVNGQLLGQPSQNYPFMPITAPRVDNSNQPWYGGNRMAAQGVPKASPAPSSNSDLMQNAAVVKGVADLTSGLKNIWSDLGVGDWFTSNDNQTEDYENAANWF